MGKKRIEQLMDFFNINIIAAKEIDKLMTSIGKSAGKLSLKKQRKVMKEISDWLPNMFGIQELYAKDGTTFIYAHSGFTYNNTIIYNVDTRWFVIWNVGDFISSKENNYGANYFKSFY